ncbi:MAG: amino acid ABC transporter permease [Alphaproteobacteria bacterium]|jgi:general L-amino acid transport system permease protein|nr:amino acid ABC transporter permease [Alphaproteobacteria bacterium]
MSDTTNLPNRVFVREKHIPQAPPPLSTAGVIGWLRENLFSSPLNAFLTILSLYLLYSVLPPLIDWVFLSSVWTGNSNLDCKGIEGACWAIIPNRFGQFIYGFYPEAERWRVNLTFVLFCLNLLPILSDRVPGRAYAAVFIVAIFPIIAYVLMYGAFGLPIVPTDKWGGLALTLVLASVAILFSLPLGILLALGRRSEMPIIRTICIAFIELWRAVPLITVLFMASFMLPLFAPEGVNFNELMRALIGFTMFSSAYMAEVVRGGLQALPKGQNEAAQALGLNYWQSMRLIILPQALKIVIPGIVNTFIGLFKDTALVSIIGLFDLLLVAKASVTDAKWLGLEHEAYIFVAVIYFVFCFSMSRYSLWLERKLDTGHR